MIPGALIPQIRRGQFATDFGDHAIGTVKNAQGWTTLGTNTDWNIDVEASAVSLSGKRLVSDKDVADIGRSIRWARIASVADVEVLGLIRILDDIGTADRTWGFLTVRFDTDGDPYYICLPTRRSNVKKFEIGRGDGAGGGVLEGNVNKAFSTSTTWWVRFRVIGNSLKGKMWQFQTAEPTTWELDLTDTNFPGAGFTGLSSYYEDCNYACLWYSVATGGNTAPSPGG